MVQMVGLGRGQLVGDLRNEVSIEWSGRLSFLGVVSPSPGAGLRNTVYL